MQKNKKYGALVWLFILVACFLAPNLLKQAPYELHILVLTCLFAALGMSFNLVWGYTGLLSLSHTASFGIGAYAAAVLSTKIGIPFWMEFLASGIGGGLAALLIGIPALRMAKSSFVMVTLAFFLICYVVANQWVAVTDGPAGIHSIPAPSILLPVVGLINIAGRQAYYYSSLSFLAFVVFVALRITRSRVGRVLVAIREDEVLAQSVGVNIFKYKLMIFILGSSMAGMVGNLFAHYIGVVGPDIFDFFFVVRVLIIVIAGGAGTIVGVLVGAVVFTIMPEVLRIASELREFMFAIVFTLVMLYMPTGIAGKWKDLYIFVERKIRHASSAN